MLLKIGRKRPNFCASVAGGAKGPPAQLWAVGPPKFLSQLSFHFLKIRVVKLNWDLSVPTRYLGGDSVPGHGMSHCELGYGALRAPQKSLSLGIRILVWELTTTLKKSHR